MLILKGFIIGVCKIIPGVSGGMIAISLGLYDKGIEAISNFFKDVKKNLCFLGLVGSGILLAIILFSKIINYALDKFYLPTMLLFLGLILGGFPSLIKKVDNTNKKNYVISLVIMLLILVLGLVKPNNSDGNLNFISMIFVGIIESMSTVIPGLSGTAMLMLTGYYKPLINVFSNLGNLTYITNNLNLIIPFILSLTLSTIILVKIMNYLLKKHEVRTNYAIIGLMTSSIILLFLETLKNNYSIYEIIIGLILLMIGYKISKRLK